jgi:outer membrane protein assembly factor BamD (BamD/ComL family)
MQRARAALGRDDAHAALEELDRFRRDRGWRKLSVEASLLRIEALSRAGRTEEARQQAARFVKQHPNNPLVDRAQSFAAPTASGDVEPSKESQ